MKKFSKLAIISLVMGALLLFTACGNSATSGDAASGDADKNQEVLTKVDEIKKAGKIVLGTSADYPPYEFHKAVDGKDEIVGFDIEIAKEIAKDLGVELEIKDMDFDGLLMALNAGKVDFVMAGMTPDAERQKVVDFSEIYYKAVHGVVIKAENKDTFKTVEDLAGKKVGAQKGAIQEDIAVDEIENVQLKSLGKIPDLILEVKNNKIDAVVMEKPVADSYVDNNQDLMLMDVTFDDGEGGSSVAVKKGSTDLVDEINKTLERLMNDGSVDKFVVEAQEMVDPEQ